MKNVSKLCLWFVIALMICNNNHLVVLATEVSKDHQNPTDHWAYDDISQLYNMYTDMKDGDKKHTNLDQQITRAQFVKLILLTVYDDDTLAKKLVSLDDSVSFNDMEGHWASKYVKLAVQLELAGGYKDGTFRPDNTITRAEAMKLLTKSNPALDDYTIRETSQFNDVEKKYWAYPFIQTVRENRLVMGYPDGSFKPNKNISLAEGFIIAERSINYQSAYTYLDNLDDILIEVDKPTAKTGETVTFQIDASKILSDVRRKDNLSYRISLMTEDGLISNIEAGQKTYTLTITEDVTEDVYVRIMPELIEEYNGLAYRYQPDAQKIVAIKLTTEQQATPKIKLVDDNGVTQFIVDRTSQAKTYEVIVMINNKEMYRQKMEDMTQPIPYISSGQEGLYTYYVEATDKTGKKITSNKFNYLITSSSDIIPEKDQDADGLDDTIEKEIQTDSTKADTDGDGLLDGYEYFVLQTSPIHRDSDGDGVADGDEDHDEDQLTNLEEIEQGTSPTSKDTDEDRLTDYEEIKEYNTDPLGED